MKKKLFAIFALLIVAAGITAVSSFDLGDLMGSSEPQNVTINGIDFNIPAGFSEEKDVAINGEVGEATGVKLTTWGKTYTKNGDENVISIGVGTYEGEESLDDLAAYIGNGTEEINGVSGYTYDDGGYGGFVYVKDNKVIILSTTDKELLKDVIIK